MTNGRILVSISVTCSLLAAACSLEPTDDGSTSRTPSWDGVLSTVILTGERPAYTNIDETESVDDPCMKVVSDAHTVLQNHCSMCHNAGPASLGNPPFDFIMNEAKLASSTWDREGEAAGTGPRFVTPGDPDNSLIYTRAVMARNMPPLQGDPSQPYYPRVNYSEGSVLFEWIANCWGDAPAPSGAN